MRDYESLKSDGIAALRAAREALNLVIADYPTPVSGCDAQYTHLLAERRRLIGALDALEAEVFIPTPRTLTRFAGVESR